MRRRSSAPSATPSTSAGWTSRRRGGPRRRSRRRCGGRLAASWGSLRGPRVSARGARRTPRGWRRPRSGAAHHALRCAPQGGARGDAGDPGDVLGWLRVRARRWDRDGGASASPARRSWPRCWWRWSAWAGSRGTRRRWSTAPSPTWGRDASEAMRLALREATHVGRGRAAPRRAIQRGVEGGARARRAGSRRGAVAVGSPAAALALVGHRAALTDEAVSPAAGALPDALRAAVRVDVGHAAEHGGGWIVGGRRRHPGAACGPAARAVRARVGTLERRLARVVAVHRRRLGRVEGHRALEPRGERRASARPHVIRALSSDALARIALREERLAVPRRVRCHQLALVGRRSTRSLARRDAARAVAARGFELLARQGRLRPLPIGLGLSRRGLGGLDLDRGGGRRLGRGRVPAVLGSGAARREGGRAQRGPGHPSGEHTRRIAERRGARGQARASRQGSGS